MAAHRLYTGVNGTQATYTWMLTLVPSVGVKVMVYLPARSVTKSVALYCVERHHRQSGASPAAAAERHQPPRWSVTTKVERHQPMQWSVISRRSGASPAAPPWSVTHQSGGG
jgi:hypothetical protein